VLPLHGHGGLERSVRDLVRHLASRRVDVTLIVPPPTVRHDPRDDPFSAKGITVRHVPYLTFPLANRKGTTILDRSTSYLLYGVRAGALAARLARSGEVDVIHVFGASGLGAARRSRSVPLVLNPQGLEEFGATSAEHARLKRVGYAPLRWAVRRVARTADAILATDRSLESTVARHLTPKPGQMVTVPNGIDLLELGEMAGPADGALIRQRNRIGADELVLLSVGRIEFNKGFDVLAEALGRAVVETDLGRRAWRWVIVGSGPFRRDLEAAIDRRGLSKRVIMTGRTSETDLHAWYEAASLFIHPTRYEGSSLVTLEAMGHRRAVIATRAGGLPDKVRPGASGWLVEPEDVEGLSKAVVDAVSDPARLDAFGQAGRAVVEQEFSWPVLVDHQIALYEQLIDQRRSAR
jgi:glycosyltransferase involved in cell wall biosynthesis